ncbi:hypothetical protein ACQY74_001078 (plasmid) [Rhizobium leguminosarum bv. trifolii]
MIQCCCRQAVQEQLMGVEGIGQATRQNARTAEQCFDFLQFTTACR